jgi:single-strand DNA-binding protein
MSTMNKVLLIGRLGADPELRYTASGMAVANFRIATTEQWRDKKTGDRMESTEWHRIVVWGKTAENCGQYLAKGRLVSIEGRIQSRKWNDRDGHERIAYEIQCREVKFLDGKGVDNGVKQAVKPAQTNVPAPQAMPHESSTGIPEASLPPEEDSQYAQEAAAYVNDDDGVPY